MEAAKEISDKKERRFRVHKSKNEVFFYGSLTDTTTFEALEDVLVDGCICDFKELDFASWMGLTALNSYIVGKGFKVTIRNIPRQIYDCLKILDGTDSLMFESSQIWCIDKEKASLSRKVYNFNDLEAKYEDSELIEDQNNLLMLPKRFALQSAFKCELPIMFSKGWMKDDCEEATFWLSYVSFVQATLDLSSTLLYATESNLLELISLIAVTVEGGEQGLKIVDPKTSYTLVARLKENIEKVKASCDSITAQMALHEDKTRKVLAKIIKEASEPTSKEAFFDLIKEYFQNIGDISSLAAKFEESGPAIGDELTKLRVVMTLKNGLTNVTQLEGEKLEAIREAFAIMDIMSEDSWPDTKTEILNEIDTIEARIGKCVTTLQGFDLLRQILEHRYNEGDIIKEQLDDVIKENIHWAGLKDALFEKIGKQLVTDQEKAAYAFYLPEGFSQYGEVDRKEPGDVLLF